MDNETAIIEMRKQAIADLKMNQEKKFQEVFKIVDSLKENR